MIAFASKHGPQPPPQSHKDPCGKIDGLVDTIYVQPSAPQSEPALASTTKDASPPSLQVAAPPLDKYVHTSLVGMSSPPAAAPKAKQPAPSDSSSAKGLWIVVFVIGTLIRVAINSNHEQRPNPAANLQAMRQLETLFQNRPQQLRALERLHLLESLAKLDPKHAADAHAGRAWILATCPDASVRNGKEAVEEATLAYKQTGGTSAKVMGTLAASYAEVGDFKRAVEWQEKAQKAYTVQERAQWGFLLDLYKSGKPFREWPPDVLPPQWAIPQPAPRNAAPNPRPTRPLA